MKLDVLAVEFQRLVEPSRSQAVAVLIGAERKLRVNRVDEQIAAAAAGVMGHGLGRCRRRRTLAPSVDAARRRQADRLLPRCRNKKAADHPCKILSVHVVLILLPVDRYGPAVRPLIRPRNHNQPVREGLARQKPGWNVRSIRSETRLPDGCCDVVLMRNVYHHVTQPQAFGRAVRKALKDGGRLAVIDFDTGALWFHGGRPDDTSPRRAGHGVSRRDAIAELSAAGFQLETEIPRWSGPLWLTIFSAR